MREIQSRQNEEIKAITKLKMQKERKSQQKFLAQGLRVCKTLAQSILPEAIYCTTHMLEKAKTIVPPEKTKEIIVLVSDPVMEKISTTTTPSGIVGLFPIAKNPSLDTLSSGIVLANISNPGNMGTLIRTCAAMGFKSVVLVEGADPFGPKVIQASAGQIANVNIFSLYWEKLLEHKKNLKLVALIVSGGKQPEQIDFKDSLLIIGSEAHGIPENWVTDCDERLTLPMPGKTESLNAAVAGSIAMYLASQLS
ncbi:TrmH family RNA methyltransferase [Candidatus Dependentiae bacterium]